MKISPGKARRLRERAMLSQAEVAQAVDVSKFTVYRWERGEEPVGVHPKTARRLSKVLGAGQGELLAGEEPSVPLVPPLDLGALYAADPETRLRALAVAAAQERRDYVAELDAALERAERAIIEDAAAEATSDADERVSYAGRRKVLRRYISRLVVLRDEATGDLDAPPPSQEDVAELVAHAGTAS